MILVDTYEKYKKLNGEYSKVIDEMIYKNFDNLNKEEIIKKLSEYNSEIQALKSEVDSIESKDKDNLNDLNYLVVDLMFLSIDLINFYNYNEVERFKMRATNYLNKQRRSEIFSN